MQIGCYKTQQELLLKSCCKLTERSFEAFKKTLIITSDAESAQSIDNSLWTYSRKNFIPHAQITDPLPEAQPVLICEHKQLDELPNIAIESVVMINPDKQALGLCFEFFSKHNIQKLSIIHDSEHGIKPQDLKVSVEEHISDIKNIKFYEQLTVDKWKYVT